VDVRTSESITAFIKTTLPFANPLQNHILNRYLYLFFSMSQIPIREYDAKHIVFNHLQIPYHGYLIQSQEDLQQVPVGQRVIKPDQLFGKRGKHGLIGVNLDNT
jgi:hypothetical protein